MSERYVCSLPYLPPSMNEYTGWHWAAKRRFHDSFQKDLWAVMNEKGNVIPRGFEGAQINTLLTFATKRRRDSDNFGMPMNKWIQDVLVTGGVIPDDTADRCTSYNPVIVAGSEEQTLVVVTLEPRSHPTTTYPEKGEGKRDRALRGERK